VRLDITDADSCTAAVAIATRRSEASTSCEHAFDDGDHHLFVKANLDDWRKTMDTNLFGTLQADPGRRTGDEGARRWLRRHDQLDVER